MPRFAKRQSLQPSLWLWPFLLVCNLVFWATPGYAQPLEDIQVSAVGDDARIKLLFDRSLRYERHFPWNRGDTMVIFLLQGRVKPGQQTETQRMSKRPPEGSNLPLRDVTYEDTPDGPKIVVKFTKSVSYELKPSNDNRSLSIFLKGMAGLVTSPATRPSRPVTPAVTPAVTPGLPLGTTPGVKPAPVKKTAPPEEPKRHHFVLNLESSLRPIKSIKKLPASARKNRRAYISKVVINNRTWYRLRLGYFATREEADTTRNLVRHIYPSAWIDLASPKEQEFASGRVVTRVAKKPEPRAKEREIIAPPAPSVSQLDSTGILERGKLALKRGRDREAIRFFIQALKTEDKKIAPEAQELLGLARERVGQKNLAIHEYKTYLKQFPDEEGADRVQKRLDNLVGVSKKHKLRRRRVGRRNEDWRFYGTWSQTYYRGNSKVDTETNTGGTIVNEPTLTSLDQSALFTNLDFTLRKRTRDSDHRVVFSGDNRYNFLDTSSSTSSSSKSKSDSRVRKAYVESKDKEYQYFFKVGRQAGRYGVLSRFDGLIAGYNPLPKWRVNVIGGQPDDTIAPQSDRTFWGLSVDAGTFGGNWAGNLYYINATIDTLTDRQAVGSELRFFSTTGSAYALVDYDIYFDDLNILLAQGSWQAPTKTSINLLYDYRNNPPLQTSNALLGEQAKSIDELLGFRTEDEIFQLARDRTAESKVYALSVVQQIGKKYQLGVDLNRVNVSGLPASTTTTGIIPASDGTGNIDTVVLKGIGIGMLFDNEVSLLGFSNTNNEKFKVKSVFITERLKFFKNWRVDFNYRWSKQENSNNSESTRKTPSLKLDYRWDSVSFEFEYGRESTTATSTTQKEDTIRDYYSLGYRWDF